MRLVVGSSCSACTRSPGKRPDTRVCTQACTTKVDCIANMPTTQAHSLTRDVHTCEIAQYSIVGLPPESGITTTARVIVLFPFARSGPVVR